MNLTFGVSHLLKAIRNFPYPLRWKGGSVIMHARLLPSSESFSWYNQTCLSTSTWCHSMPFVSY